MFAKSSEQTEASKLNVMYTTQQHIAAIFDSIQSIGIDMVRSTTEWDQLTTDEQMLVEQEAQSL
jgi:hypothetical protein